MSDERELDALDNDIKYNQQLQDWQRKAEAFDKLARRWKRFGYIEIEPGCNIETDDLLLIVEALEEPE